MTDTVAEASPARLPAGFWYLVGIAALLIGGAIAWRIAIGTGGVSLDANKDGQLSLKIDEARNELDQAKSELAQAQATLQTREEALHKATEELAAKEARIQELIAKLEAESTAVAGRGGSTEALKSELADLKREKTSAALAEAPRLDPHVFQGVQDRLRRVDGIRSELSRTR